MRAIPLTLVLVGGACGAEDSETAARDGGPGGGDGSTYQDSGTGGGRDPVCLPGESAGEVQAPVFVRNQPGETGWFASPVVSDLDGDGQRELVAAYYSIFVYDAAGELLAQASDGEGRVYAPHVVADLDGDGVVEIAAGNDRHVLVYEWRDGGLSMKAGWPADTTTAGNPPEVRGLAAADLDGDGEIEIVATTTQTEPTEDGGAQVFVFRPDGSAFPGWPRYDALAGSDADRNGMGHHGFGCYGLNVGIGSIDDDDDLEVIATYDNHHIQAFDPDGVAIDAAPWFTNRDSSFDGMPMTWGQFIRWFDPAVEENHYDLHTGEWPHPSWTEWLQWTASPPNVVDLDGDGLAEVVGVPNVEMNEPYETQAYAVVVLEGAHGDGSRSAMRKAGWEDFPRGDAPIRVDGWYPPGGVPAPLTADVQGDAQREVVVSLNDGYMRAFDAGGNEAWRFGYRHGQDVMYASEPVAGDLNQDGSPEIVFATFGAPEVTDSGWLVILGADGTLLHDVPLPNPGENGNGNGAPAAPGIGDPDGDGAVEIFVQTFDHGMDVFEVPGSAENCLIWPTGRGGPRRTGRAGD